jgi:hypothetical protein
MLRRSKAPELDRKFLASKRQGRFPRLALRARSNDHPMAMFAVLVTAAFLSMALLTPASAILPDGAKPKLADPAHDTGKTSRLPPVSDAGRACHGQAWGAESEDCVLAIIRGSGKSETRRIRMIASAEPLRTTPNIF